jgi:hypothetical protein
LITRSFTACSLICLLAFAESLPAQQAPSSAALAQDDASKPRVYVTDSDSWQMKGATGGSSDGFAGVSEGGARPQTAEVIKTFGQRCPQVVINQRPDLSQYVVRLEHEGGKGYLRKDNKVAVFVRQTGDSIFSKSTMSLGGSVQDACAAISTHWSSHAEQLKIVPAPTTTTQVVSVAPVAAADKPKVSVTSTPAGADIEINGNFVGSTPSNIEVDAGKNEVKITKKGYAPWSRTLAVKGGTITVNAELEPQGSGTK